MNFEQLLNKAKKSGKPIYIPYSLRKGKTTVAKQLRADGYVVYEEHEMFTLAICEEENPCIIWRRFIPLVDNSEQKLSGLFERGITRDDIELILRTVKLHPDYANNDRQ